MWTLDNHTAYATERNWIRKALSVSKDDVRKLVENLIAAKREYSLLVEDEEEQHVGDPASARQLAALEKRLGKPLPPSYRAFLELHDGWADFDGDGAILSVEDQSKPWVKKRVASLGGHFEEDGDSDPFKAGALPVMIGKTIRNYLVLDPSKTRRTGEMDFVLFDLAREEERFKDFTSYLKWDLKLTKQLIKEEK
nr:SMI1/KNR4 family protein [Myxococcus sp. AM011]